MRFVFLMAALALNACAVTPPEPPEPVGELFPINKPALSAVEVTETRAEPVKKVVKPKAKKRRVRRVK